MTKEYVGVQNAAVRLVVGAGRHDRVSEHLKNLHWLPVEQRVEFKTALMTFRCLYDIAPVYLSDLVEWYKPTRELRSCNSHTIVSPSFRLAKYGGRSFHPAPSIWNALPLSVRFFLFVYPQISIRIWAWCAPVTTLKSRDCWTPDGEASSKVPATRKTSSRNTPFTSRWIRKFYTKMYYYFQTRNHSWRIAEAIAILLHCRYSFISAMCIPAGSVVKRIVLPVECYNKKKLNIF